MPYKSRSNWHTSRRKDRLPDDWDQIRKVVLTRCGNRCQHREESGARCYQPATDVDHIQRGDDLGGPGYTNLQGLCGTHHALKSAREGNERKAEIRALLKRPEEENPGRIDGPPQPPVRKGF